MTDAGAPRSCEGLRQTRKHIELRSWTPSEEHRKRDRAGGETQVAYVPVSVTWPGLTQLSQQILQPPPQALGDRLGARVTYCPVVDGHVQPPCSAADRKLGRLGRPVEPLARGSPSWDTFSSGASHRWIRAPVSRLALLV